MWSKRFGSSLDKGGVLPDDVVFDSAGNIVMTGTILRDVDLGGGNLPSAAPSSDVFVAKYSPHGAYRWAKRFVGRWDDTVAGVATDTAGNVFVSGSFGDTVDFGGGELTGPAAPGPEGFLVKLAP